MADIKIVDVSKLVFNPTFQGASKITVLNKQMKRHFPMSKETIISCVERGLHHDNLNTWFTQKSIKAASKAKPSNSTEA